MFAEQYLMSPSMEEEEEEEEGGEDTSTRLSLPTPNRKMYTSFLVDRHTSEVREREPGLKGTVSRRNVESLYSFSIPVLYIFILGETVYNSSECVLLKGTKSKD